MVKGWVDWAFPEVTPEWMNKLFDSYVEMEKHKLKFH